MTLIQLAAQAVVDKWPLIVSYLAVVAAVLVGQAYLKRDPLAHLPEIGKELGTQDERRMAFMMGAQKLYRDGYNKFKNGIFTILTSRGSKVLVVSTKFLPELKNLPDDVLSFDDAIRDSMHSKEPLLPQAHVSVRPGPPGELPPSLHTLMSVGDPTIPFTVKANLTPALPRLNATISDEVERSFLREMPPCDDWTPININSKLQRIVAMVSGRVFIGPELCHDEAYLDAAVNYTVEMVQATQAVDSMAPWKRSFLASRLPEIKKVKARLAQADAFLKPVVQKRLALSPDDRPDDMLQWMLNSQQRFGVDKTVQTLARLQLSLSFASIHTTSVVATSCFYNLAAYPNIIPDLRDEILSVRANHNGEMSSAALQDMKKLDSFIKETMRFNAPSVSSFARKVNKSFSLSNGQVIPAGVVIEVPVAPVLHDPEFFPEPERFDHLRYYKLREHARDSGEAEKAAMWQFVSVNPLNMLFGYGRHACPGRFFAANEIKMFLATTLQMYDVKFTDGATERPKDLEWGNQTLPNPAVDLLFKRVKA